MQLKSTIRGNAPTLIYDWQLLLDLLQILNDNHPYVFICAFGLFRFVLGLKSCWGKNNRYIFVSCNRNESVMNPFNKKSQAGMKRILLHLLFWVSYISFFVLQYAFISPSFDFKRTTTGLCFTVLIDISASYFTFYILLQRFLLKKNYLWFAILLPLSAAVFIILQRAMLYYVNIPFLYPDSPIRLRGFWEFNPFYSFLNIYLVVVLFASIKLIKYWFIDQKQKAELESKNKISEMALLRSQLNPHFLFNTLNNIDALIMKDQQKASDAIIKLSDILRSVIYESDEKVAIYKEIDYLNSFIDLQRLRLKDPDFVSFEVDVKCRNQKIAPMLLIPFVENAFKHGLKNVPSPGIYIKLYCNRNSVIFEVKNQINDQIIQNKDAVSGIGLANTKRRLELLYPKKHQLDVGKDDHQFKAKLMLNTSENED